MFTGIPTHARFLFTAIAVLTGAAIVHSGAAAADPSQDDQFLALLDKEGIPALSGIPSIIVTAHNVCRALDGGMSAGRVVDNLTNYAFSVDPTQDRGRYERTEARFVTAAVGAYCPYDQGKIASAMANSAPGWNEPTLRVAAYPHNVVNSGSDLREPPRDMINLSATWQEPTGIGAVRLSHLMNGGLFVAGRRSDCDAHGALLASLIGTIPGEVTPPNPPQIPAPPPPTAQTLTPPRPAAALPRPKQLPRPPQQLPPPPPQQPPPPPRQEPPAVGPQPGGAAGSGGSGNAGGNGGGNGGGGNGGGGAGPAEPAPTPPMPPGFVRLAP
jgi:uncharacterized membrane protein YgcG